MFWLILLVSVGRSDAVLWRRNVLKGGSGELILPELIPAPKIEPDLSLPGGTLKSKHRMVQLHQVIADFGYPTTAKIGMAWTVPFSRLKKIEHCMK